MFPCGGLSDALLEDRGHRVVQLGQGDGKCLPFGSWLLGRLDVSVHNLRGTLEDRAGVDAQEVAYISALRHHNLHRRGL